MGRSYTYNVFGLSEVHTDKRNPDKHSDVYPCTTKLDMVRARKQADERGQPMISWQSQTEQGREMLGDSYQLDKNLNLSNIKTIECPKCKGNGCGICNFSGIITKREFGNYMPWQLEPEGAARDETTV